MGDSGLPLGGIGVLVTRTREQAAQLIQELEGLGARVFPMPSIRIQDLQEPEGFGEALRAIQGFDHLVFTSVNGVHSFLRRTGPADPPPSRMPPAICVGPKTAEAWRSGGGRVSVVPGKYTAFDLAETLGGVEGRSFLILRPEKVETELGALLREKGAKVREVVLYRTLPAEGKKRALDSLLERGELDVVLFASPSAVEGLLSMAGRLDEVRRLLAICIGPTTARAAEARGFEKVAFPGEHTREGMVEELLARAGSIKERR